MLRARKHAPTPSLSVVFTFGFAVESIKKLDDVSIMEEKEMKQKRGQCKKRKWQQKRRRNEAQRGQCKKRK